jgi:hypothetical protein
MALNLNSVGNAPYYIENNEKLVAPVSDSFYFQPDQINTQNWSKFFPYQLLILTNNSTDDTHPSYSKIASFTLPISPQELSLDMNFASTLQASINGHIIEQSSGAPFRDIFLSGTTGLTIVKNQAAGNDSLSNNLITGSLGGIFSGTVANARGVAQSINQFSGGGLLNLLSSSVNVGLGGVNSPDLIPAQSTGYYQFKLLQKFLEYYTESKRKITTITIPQGAISSKNLRLGFAMWKDEAIYLVTGVKFTLKRSQTAPMEYMYSLQMKAWRRINPKLVGVVNSFQNVPLPAKTPNLFSVLTSRMGIVNNILQQSEATVKALVQDLKNDVGEISRETQLFLKNATSLATTISDLPNSIKSDLLPFVVQNWQTIRQQFKDLTSSPPAQFVSSPNTLVNQSALTGSNSFSNLSPNSTPTANVTDLQANQALSIINPSKLPIPPAIINAINAENNRVKNFTRLDFDNKRQRIIQVANNLSDIIGLGGSDTFNSIYNHNPLPEVHAATISEINVLFALNEMVLILNHLAASRTIDPPKPSSLEYVAGLAQKSGIAFTVPQSKFAVPFPYGFTLEQLALQYLGTPDRWHEIAVLNGLRAPYVDETGFQVPFQVNGVGNSLFVNSINNLFIGQPVFVSATNIPRNSRRIVNIITIYDGFYEIIINGKNDLNTYLVTNSAILEAFLPGTVNSQQLIFIPSSKVSGKDLRTLDIPGVDIYDPLLQVGGTDLLLTNSMDLAIDPGGDVKIAYGLQNIIQTIKLALATPQGSLLHHPEYGLPITIGESLADMNANNLAQALQNLFSGDPTFTSVSNVSVNVNAPGASISLTVNIAGVQDTVPLSFNILR